MNQVTVEFLARQVEMNVKRAQSTLKKFADKIASGQAFCALQWADDAFAAAADEKLWLEIEHFVGRAGRNELRVYDNKFGQVAVAAEDCKHATREPSGEDLLRILKREFDRRVMRAARYPARSTSPSSNQAEQQELRAAAEFCEFIDSLLP